MSWKLTQAKLLLVASEVLIAAALLLRAERRSLEGVQLAMVVLGGLLCYSAAVYLGYSRAMSRSEAQVRSRGLWHFIGEFLALATVCYLLSGTAQGPFMIATGFGIGLIYAAQVRVARAWEWTFPTTAGARAMICAREYGEIRALRRAFEAKGYEVEVCRFAGSLIESAQKNPVDVIVCEASWPDLDLARNWLSTAHGHERVNWQVVDLSRKPRSAVDLQGVRNPGEAS